VVRWHSRRPKHIGPSPNPFKIVSKSTNNTEKDGHFTVRPIPGTSSYCYLLYEKQAVTGLFILNDSTNGNLSAIQ